MELQEPEARLDKITEAKAGEDIWDIGPLLMINVQDFDSTPNILNKIRFHFRHAILYPFNQHVGDIGISDVDGMVVM